MYRGCSSRRAGADSRRVGRYDGRLRRPALELLSMPSRFAVCASLAIPNCFSFCISKYTGGSQEHSKRARLFVCDAVVQSAGPRNKCRTGERRNRHTGRRSIQTKSGSNRMIPYRSGCYCCGRPNDVRGENPRLSLPATASICIALGKLHCRALRVTTGRK